MAERGRRHQRDGLHEICADKLARSEHRIEQQQRHDDQGTRADRGHAHDRSAHHADRYRGDRLQTEGPDLGHLTRHDERLAPPGLQELDQALHDDRGRRHDQRHPECDFQPVLDLGAVPQLLEDEDTGERGRHRPQSQAADQGPVHRSPSHVDAAADRLHDHGGDQVARDRGEGLDLEEQDEDRSHQRAAAHAG